MPVSQGREKIGRLLLWATGGCLLLFLTWLLVYAAQSIPAARNLFAKKNLFIPICAGALLLLLFLIQTAGRFSRWEEKRLRRIMWLLFAATVLLQLAFLWFVRYYVLYDNALVISQALEMGQTHQINGEAYHHYFSRYPHNYPMLLLLNFVFKAAGVLKIHNTYWITALLGMACMDVTLLLGMKTAVLLKGYRMGALISLLSLLNPLVYIWMQWPYTTICSLPFLAGAVWLGACLWKGKRPAWRYALLLGLVLGLGSRIRVTTLFFLLAAVICGLALGKIQARQFVPVLAAMAVVFLAMGAVEKSYVSFDNEEYVFPKTHWLMLGLNYDSAGEFSGIDLNFTESFSGQEAKQEANLEKIRERIGILKERGILPFYLRKLRVMWRDGSCGYQQEWLCPADQGGVGLYLAGDKSDLFLYYVQVYYVTLLLLLLFGTGLELYRDRDKDSYLWVLRLLLLGNVVFYLIWEAQSHYRLGLLGLFLLLGADGLERVREAAGCNRIRRTGEISGTGLRKGFRRYGSCLAGAVLALVIAASLLPSLTGTPVQVRDYSMKNTYEVGEGLTDIKRGDEIVQTFTASRPFNHISLPVRVKNTGKTSCHVYLTDEKGQVLREKTVRGKALASGTISMDFDPVTPGKREIYRLCLEFQGMGKKGRITLPRFHTLLDIYPCGTLSRNGKPENGDLLLVVSRVGEETYV